jgi:predicted TIM-barrel fold metal-dependent hydrolase
VGRFASAQENNHENGDWRKKMYEKDGEKYFIVDSHVHLWDARAENLKNIHGKQFIDCFYDYHMNLSPDEVKWGYDDYCYYGGDRLMKDVFEEGYADRAILQATLLSDFYVNGFGQTEEAWALTQKHPDKLTYNHAFDPRNGENGLAQLRRDAKRFNLQGVKLYTAEWNGESRGYKLSDPWAYRYLEACQELGIKNIHVHKGPTIRPLDRDAFDVADVDHAATDFLDLNFIVEHCGLPRLEDFCWIATQETNVYAGLAVALPFIHTRPRYFAQIIGELLYWLGEDKITFASDYAIWTPKWLIERFVDFQIPADLTEYGQITVDQKKKILGLNAARLYGFDVPAEFQVADVDAAASNTAMEDTSTSSDRAAARLTSTPS